MSKTVAHVGGVVRTPCRDIGSFVGLQLWATDVEHRKEMVEESTDAGANLRTHR